MNESQNYLLMLASDFTKIYASTHENYVFTRGLLSSISKIPVHLCWGIFQLLNYVIFFLILNSTTENPLITEDSALHFSVA